MLNISIITLLNLILALVIISFFLSRNNIIMCLLSLELILLVLFLSIIISLSIINQTLSYPIFMLCMGACEASLGLSLVINLTRFNGNDMLNNSNLNF